MREGENRPNGCIHFLVKHGASFLIADDTMRIDYEGPGIAHHTVGFECFRVFILVHVQKQYIRLVLFEHGFGDLQLPITD